MDSLVWSGLFSSCARPPQLVNLLRLLPNILSYKYDQNVSGIETVIHYMRERDIDNLIQTNVRSVRELIDY